MTTMKSADGSQYVLVLTKEQAELLGTLRFSHVASGNPLYAVLRDLPFKMSARFRTNHCPTSGKPIFHELLMRRMLPQHQVLMDDTTHRHLQVEVLLKNDATLREERKGGWIVQYHLQHRGWTSLVGNGDEASRVYYSRNEAYRQMRKRATKTGSRLDRYRVVPNGTKDGPERDRGYYVVEYFRKLSRPRGWGRSSVHWLMDTFPTAEGARLAINTLVSIRERSRYRVKWHPNRT